MPGNGPFVFFSFVFFFPFHATPEEFENGGFTLKTHQMFSVHTGPEEFKNATITGHFGFVFEENLVRLIFWLSWRPRFRKAPFLKCFPSTRKRRADVFKFLRFEERFRKAPFSWQISVGGRPNRRNKTAFSNFSGVVWTLSPFFQLINSSQLPRNETPLVKNYGKVSSFTVAKRTSEPIILQVIFPSIEKKIKKKVPAVSAN